MSESPRWERESQEDVRAPASQPPASPTPASQPSASPTSASPPEATAEYDLEAAGLVAPDELVDPSEDDREPRLAGAREAARDALASTRSSARESLAATRETARESLAVTRESLASTAGTLADTAGRVGRFLASLDRRPEFDVGDGRDPVAELTAGSGSDPDRSGGDPGRSGGEPGRSGDGPGPDSPAGPAPGLELGAPARFPITLRGYDRAAVDAHIAELEAELAQSGSPAVPMTITEEIERLGEQTASILVVAHDKAHETARRAHEQATRAVTEAARDAERITAEAERRLHELDEETDAVWRERERLLDDVRDVSATLAALADAAGERFPAAEPVGAVESPAEPDAELDPVNATS